MSKLKYGMATASAIAAFVGVAGLSLSQALAGEHRGSQASSFTERAKNGYAIQMQECNTLKNSQPDAYEPCLEKARSTRDSLLSQTQGSEAAGQGSQGFASNQSQQQFSGQKQGPIDKMTSAVKETVAEVKEFFGSSDQGRESQQPSAGQQQGQGSGQGSAQGQQPSQQGFGAGQAMQGQDFAQQSSGAGSGQGGQNFGQQGSSTQGQQFQGQQGQSGQGSFQGGNYGQQPQGQSWQQGTGGTNQQFQSGGTQGLHGSSNPQGGSMSGSGGAQAENEYAIQIQECNTLKNSQPEAYEPCLQKAQSMRDKGSQQSQGQFSGQKQGPIDKMTSAVKETVAVVKEKLFGSPDQGSQGQSMGQGQQGGVTQGPNPLQQGFEASQGGAAGGQGGQNFGQQGSSTQGQQFQGQQGQSGQESFQGGNYGQQQPQGQSWHQGTGGTNQQSQGQQGQSGQGQGSFQGGTGQQFYGQHGQSGQGSLQGGNQQSQGQPCPQGTGGTSQQFQSGGTQGSTNQQGGPTSGSAGARGEHMDAAEYYQALARQQYATLNQECKTLKQDANVYEQCQKHAESVRDKIAGMAEQGT